MVAAPEPVVVVVVHDSHATVHQCHSRTVVISSTARHCLHGAAPSNCVVAADFDRDG
jgi:hypothetical protein